MIWDLHCHLSQALRGDTIPEKAAHLIEVGDRHGIERFCLFMGLGWSKDPTPDDLSKQNNDVLEAVAAHPGRLFGFVYLNPNHVQKSLDELERCVADGPMTGVKLWVARKCSDPQIDPIIQRAAELKAVIFQHTWLKTSGNDPGESTPEDVALLAARFPEAPLICGHTGGNWERGIAAVRDSPNVSLGFGGFDPTAGATEMAVREMGAGRVLYGSDAPGRSYASQLAKILGANISQQEKDLILGHNLKKMMTPILEAKGLPVK
jgi:predicted TIM-barrel fold metal-dependent hydrolase